MKIILINGSTPEKVCTDHEGLEIARQLGRNMAWLARTVKNTPWHDE